MHHIKLAAAAAAIALTATFVACTASDFLLPGDNVVTGDSQELFGGTVSTWAVLSEEGDVKRIGFTMDAATIRNAPTDPAHDPNNPGPPGPHDPAHGLVLSYPDVATDGVFGNHLTIDWNIHGHPPFGVFTRPHFDMHLYDISVNEMRAIDCTDLTATPEAMLPANFGADPPGAPPEGFCVPLMGQHAVDRTNPILDPASGEIFEKVMILGYYGGEHIFVEPMITRDFLLNTTAFVIEIPTPPLVGQNTMYPTLFTGTYDSTRDEWNFFFSNFIQVQ